MQHLCEVKENNDFREALYKTTGRPTGLPVQISKVWKPFGQLAVGRVEHDYDFNGGVGGKRRDPVAGHDLVAAKIGIIVVYENLHIKSLESRQGRKTEVSDRCLRWRDELFEFLGVAYLIESLVLAEHVSGGFSADVDGLL